MFIRLGVRGDGQQAVDLVLLKALEPKALPGHQAADSPAPFHNALDAGGIMGQLAYPAPSGLAAGVAQVHAVAGDGLLVALFGRLPDHQHPRTLRPMVGEGGLPVPGCEASGGIRPPGFPHRQVYKGFTRRYQVQYGFGSGPAGPGGLGAGCSSDVVDPVSLGSSDELYKSLAVISGDRKYFSGTSWIKISDKEDPSP